MKKILLLLVVLILVGCGKEEKKSKLDTILEKDNYVIIDVRTNEEYNEGHLVDSINIPYDEIENTITIEKDKTILVYCRSGQRSSIAKTTLIKMGYDVYDLGAFEKIDLPQE